MQHRYFLNDPYPFIKPWIQQTKFIIKGWEGSEKVRKATEHMSIELILSSSFDTHIPMAIEYIIHGLLKLKKAMHESQILFVGFSPLFRSYISCAQLRTTCLHLILYVCYAYIETFRDTICCKIRFFLTITTYILWTKND